MTITVFWETLTDVSEVLTASTTKHVTAQALHLGKSSAVDDGLQDCDAEWTCR
jgi:hypothetical protein